MTEVGDQVSGCGQSVSLPSRLLLMTIRRLIWLTPDHSLPGLYHPSCRHPRRRPIPSQTRRSARILPLAVPIARMETPARLPLLATRRHRDHPHHRRLWSDLDAVDFGWRDRGSVEMAGRGYLGPLGRGGGLYPRLDHMGDQGASSDDPIQGEL
jgi:hypothetical protein